MNIIAFVFIFIIISLSNASATCIGSIDILSMPLFSKKQYDPFSARSVSDQHTIRIVNHGEKACDFVLAFGATSDRRLGNAIPYFISDASQRPIAISMLPLLTPQTGLVASHIDSTMDVPFWINIERGVFVKPNQYADNMTIALYSIENGIFKKCDSKTFEIIYFVKKTLNVNVGGSNENWDINFGELRSRTQRSLSLQARSNVPYHFSIFSFSQGELRRDPPVLNQKWAISYNLLVDGKIIDLKNSPSKTAVYASPTSINGHNHNITIAIDEVNKKRAGTYKDIITIEITAAHL